MKQLWYWGSLNSNMNRSTARMPSLRSSPLGAIVRWTWLLWVTCDNAMGPGCWWPTSMPMQISMRSGKRLPGTSMAAWQFIGFGQFFFFAMLELQETLKHIFLKWPLPLISVNVLWKGHIWATATKASLQVEPKWQATHYVAKFRLGSEMFQS